MITKNKIQSFWLVLVTLSLGSCQPSDSHDLNQSARNLSTKQQEMDWYVPLLNNVYDNATRFRQKKGKWPGTFEQMFPISGPELTISSNSRQRPVTLQRSLIHFKILSRDSDKTFRYEFGYGSSEKFLKEVEM